MFQETDISPDHLEGLSHWLARKAGYPVPVDREHPFCRVLDRASKQRQGFEETLYLMGVRSTNSSDVAELYAAGSRLLVERAYRNIAGTIDPIVRNIVAKDFRPIELGQIDVANEPVIADEFFSPQDVKNSTIQWSESVITGQVKTYGFHAPISDRLFKNAEFDLIGQMIAAAAGKLGQLPVRKLADIINANPTINGTALISTDNAVASALTAATLQTAMATLERTYHAPSAFLICPPDMKTSVAGLLQSAPALNLQMVSNPWLDSTTYCYLIPAPDSKPVFAKLAFNHPLVPGIRKQRLPEDAVFFGQTFCMDLEFDLVPISRAIVRIGA